MKYLLLILFSFFVGACTNKEVLYADYNIVPKPQHIELFNKEQSPFKLNASTLITFPQGNSDLEQLAEFLAIYIQENNGITLKTAKKTGSLENVINLNIDTKQDTTIFNEAYKIEVSNKSIEISGNSNAGVFYAIQTIRKSLPVRVTSEILFPAAHIKDNPRFSHRGVSLDVSRHFFSVDFIKKYIDVLALYNMNIFHWHLTDDQGWRIEIKKFPKLTEIGSIRSETAIDRHSELYDGKPHGGYYTQEQIRDIVEYAHRRHISVIPEIDIPGHTLALLASYPELGCTQGPYKVARDWGIFDDVLCIGNDSVFSFLDGVFSEVAELFPSEYIHIGGDECSKVRWRNCPKCQQRVQSLHFVEKKEYPIDEQLQNYFIHQVETILNQKGKKIIGWDEILHGGIAPNTTIMSWRGTGGGMYAANSGYDVIMTPEEFVYLDYYQSDDADDEPYTYGWLTKLDKVYGFEPIPQTIDRSAQKHILGGQVNIWTEYMPDSSHVEYMLLPRMAAFAERLWSDKEVTDYSDFIKRMYKQSSLLDHLNYKNSKDAYNIQTTYIYDTIAHTIQVKLSTFDNAPIYYTMDNRKNGTVTNKDLQYSQALIIDKTTRLRAVAYRDGIPKAWIDKNFLFNEATCHPINLYPKPNNRYFSEGAGILVNGLKGLVSTYRTGSWIALENETQITIQLNSQTEFSTVKIGNYINTRGLLYPPKSLKIEASNDGKFFVPVYEKEYPKPHDHIINSVDYINASFPKVKANFVRIELVPTHKTDKWHKGDTKPSLLMIDEIEIN